VQIKPNDAFGKQMISNLEVGPDARNCNVDASKTGKNVSVISRQRFMQRMQA